MHLYLVGAGMLGDAMGEAAHGKGFDAGRAWTEPSKGDTRIDITDEIRTLAYLADVGFHHVIKGGRASSLRDAGLSLPCARSANNGRSWRGSVS